MQVIVNIGLYTYILISRPSILFDLVIEFTIHCNDRVV
jgi:hypothetical protein